ncbi:MAG: two-component regulator propeller domain-containing protein [Desulfosarcinaceae bacterium]|nr:two-component regulator propeller domain-containing protein [Desulfosarcinaceae bacterium]
MPNRIPSSARFARVPVLVGLFLLSIATGAYGIQTRFERLGVREGLHQRTITCGLQDHLGFLWFGTEDGLLRYDGYGFREFRTDPARDDSLASNLVYALLEDRRGRLWVGTVGGGLHRFNRRSETFVRYQPDPADPHAISHIAVISLLEDRLGQIWVGTEGGGLNRLDPDSGRFTHYRQTWAQKQGLSFDSMWHLYEDLAGFIWIGTHGGGLNRFDPQSGQFRVYRHNPADPTSIASDTVGPIFEDSQGRLWVGGLAGLNLMDRASGRFQRFVHDPQNPHSLSHNHVWDIVEDSAGHLWLATFGGGVNRFDPVSTRAIRYTHDPSRLTSLSSNLIWFLFEDRGGVLWAGSDGGGLCKFVRRTEAFGHTTLDPKDSTGLLYSGVNAIAQAPDGRFWIANDGGGIQSWHPYTGDRALYTATDETPSRLSSDLTESIHVDAEGVVWIGTYNGGLNRFEPDKGVFRHYVYDPEDVHSLSDNRVWTIAADRSGRLWVGTRNGLNRLLPDGDRFQRYLHRADDDDSLSDNGVWSILEDSRGTLWVGTDRGLNRQLAEGRFKHYFADPGKKGALGHNTVTVLFQDRRERLWIGTNGGLCRMDPAREQFQCFTESDGLVSNSIRAMQEDDAGQLWIASKKGLSRFDPDSGRFFNFDAFDGLQGEEFGRASLRTDDGALVFGGRNGINRFFPNAIRPNIRKPPVALTAVRILGEPVDALATILETGEIRLTHRDYMVSFEYAALDFNAPAKNRYRYRMEGLDREWVLAGTRRSATYTNLAAGRYRFHVQGSNNSGYWNDLGAEVRLVVQPAWWNTWLFKGGLLAAVCALILVQVLRIGRRHRQLQTFNRLIENRNKALSTSEARLKAIMDNTTSLITLKALTGEYIEANRPFCRLLQRERAAIVGQDDQALFSTADAAQLRDNDAIALERGDPVELEERLQIGSRALTVISVRFSLKDTEDQPYALCTIATDITERKSSEEQIRQLQVYLQEVVDFMPSILVGVDAQGDVTQWNAQAVAYRNKAADAVLGKPVDAVLTDLPLEWTAIRQAISAGRIYRAERVRHTVDDRVRIVDLVVYPLRGKGGAGGAVLRLDEVTERVKMEEMLVQSEKMVSVGGLAAGMAHEINNPLAGIIQNLQVVRNRLQADLPKSRSVAASIGLDLALFQAYLDQRKILAMLSDVDTAARRAAAIVANMLSFSRKSEAAETRAQHSLPDLIDQTLALAASDYNFKKRYDFRKIEIIKDYDEELPPVLCDAGSFQQVLYNLLHNAAQAMVAGEPAPPRPKPRLTLRLRRLPETVRIEVADNGPGMSPEVASRIFEPFFTTKPTGEGTGLGLAVAYFIITESHQGTIHVESQPGKGSRFIIDLPVPPPTPSA